MVYCAMCATNVAGSLVSHVKRVHRGRSNYSTY